MERGYRSNICYISGSCVLVLGKVDTINILVTEAMNKKRELFSVNSNKEQVQLIGVGSVKPSGANIQALKKYFI